MNISLYGKSFLTLLDFSDIEINYLLKLAHQLKAKRKQGILGTSLQGKNIALLFEKNSTRTRCAFEVGVAEEGGNSSFIDTSISQFAKKESVIDSAKVLAGFYHGIGFRGYSQQTVEELSKHSGIPVYNGLTDEDHPTQILADLMTIEEAFPAKPLSAIKVVYVGDTRNNVANSWAYGCAKMGMHFVAYGPKELQPDPSVLANASACAKLSGATIEVSCNSECLAGADVIYTDAWVSMGEESQISNRANLLQKYQVTLAMLKQTQNPEVIFMHCLPAFHDFETEFAREAKAQFDIDIREVADDVFQSKHSLVFQQSENRLHSIKAILVATLGSVNNLG